MRRAQALALLAVTAALPLGGCVVAAVPALAGAAIARSEANRDKRKVIAAATPDQPIEPVLAGNVQPRATVGEGGGALPTLTADFVPLIDHVRSRATLWREGAPIKSLVLDNKQTVLNPVAIDCQQRQPAVLIDFDRADAATPDPLETLLAVPGWSSALSAIRELDVGIIWITSRASSEAEAVRARLNATGIDPMSRDKVAALPSGNIRKQQMRLDQARSHCVLAVVGDTRGDADEAYDFLRSPGTMLPIDSNWGAGWFILPAPLTIATTAAVSKE